MKAWLKGGLIGVVFGLLLFGIYLLNFYIFENQSIKILTYPFVAVVMLPVMSIAEITEFMFFFGL